MVGAQVFASAGGGVGPGGGTGSCITGADGRYTCGPLLQDMYFVSVNPDPADAEHPGTPYLFGYYDAAAPGHYTNDFSQKTLFMVVDPHCTSTADGDHPDAYAGATGVARDANVSVGFLKVSSA